MTKDRITSKTKFKTLIGVLDNAAFTVCYDSRKSLIQIGLQELTIETLIHELNEIEASILLFDLGGIQLANSKLKGFPYAISHITHLISPFGQVSFVDPYLSVEEEKLEA